MDSGANVPAAILQYGREIGLLHGRQRASERKRAIELVSIVPPAKCSIIYLCKHDVNERVRGKHKQISVRFVMTLAKEFFHRFLAIFWMAFSFGSSRILVSPRTHNTMTVTMQNV